MKQIRFLKICNKFFELNNRIFIIEINKNKFKREFNYWIFFTWFTYIFINVLEYFSKYFLKWIFIFIISVGRRNYLNFWFNLWYIFLNELTNPLVKNGYTQRKTSSSNSYVNYEYGWNNPIYPLFQLFLYFNHKSSRYYFCHFIVL